MRIIKRKKRFLLYFIIFKASHGKPFIFYFYYYTYIKLSLPNLYALPHLNINAIQCSLTFDSHHPNCILKMNGLYMYNDAGIFVLKTLKLCS